MTKISVWLKDFHGATAIEYALIVAGIAIALSAVVYTMGSDLVSLFQAFSDVLASAIQ